MPLRDITVKSAKSKPKAYRLFDSGGLYLEVTPSGGKHWRYKYRYLGKEKKLALGAYPEVSLLEAREKHVAARKILAAGQDPAALKKQIRRESLQKAENTFKSIALEWHENRSSMWTPRYASRLKARLEADLFPELGDDPITEISAPQLLTILRRVEQRGALEIAHRLLQYCTQIFTYAIRTQRAERNPAAELRGALKPVPRSNFASLKPDDLPAFLQELEAFEDIDAITRIALKLLLLTFVRTTELRASQPAEVNLEKGEWRIPAERMKMREAHIVPLSRQAVEAFRQLQKLTGESRFLFPNKYDPFGCMSDSTMLRALYRMGYRGIATGHGFRATASTVLNEHGFEPDVIERQLAHRERNKVRAAYNHAQYLPERRKMMQWWADYLDAAAEGKAPPAIP